MRISYRPLWVLLAQREMSKKELCEISGISTASLAKLGKGENLTTDVLLKICEALNCNINEIIETCLFRARTKRSLPRNRHSLEVNNATENG